MHFKIPIGADADYFCVVSKQSPEAHLLRAARVIVRDEAPMAHRHLFECVDRTLRDLCDDDRPFGGKVVVLGGDFRQLLPVVRRGTRAKIVDATLTRSAIRR